jgi:hypothetical protein
MLVSFKRNAQVGATPQKPHQFAACGQRATTALSLRQCTHVQEWRSRLCETLMFDGTTAIFSKRRSRLYGMQILHVRDLRLSS